MATMITCHLITKKKVITDNTKLVKSFNKLFLSAVCVNKQFNHVVENNIQELTVEIFSTNQ